MCFFKVCSCEQSHHHRRTADRIFFIGGQKIFRRRTKKFSTADRIYFKGTPCRGCYFYVKENDCPDQQCSREHRADGCDVIFKEVLP